MKALATIFLAAAVATSPAARGADEELDVKPAMAAAQAWLETVDAGRYADSWDEGARLMQSAVDKARWEDLLGAARAPLGVAVTRKLRSAAFTRQLPGGVPGEYFVIQFDTRFENRERSLEIVTPARGPDGTWKVAGYIIR